jgi:S-adenosylmethionine uptake transporter
MLGIGANILFYCLLKAFQYMDASALAPFRYCDFLVSALFGFLFFSEKPTLSTCLGFLIIIPCTCYLAYQENKKN